MTARKRVGPLPACRLAWRRVSPRSSDHRPSSSSSSSDSLPVHSSGLDAQIRLILDLRLEMYHLDYVTFRGENHDSSSGDSSERPLHSSSHSAEPSRKRCWSLVDSVPSSTPVMRSLSPTRADLLPYRIGDRDDVRDHVKIDPRDVRDDTEEYEADTNSGHTVKVGVDLISTPIVEEEIVEPAREDSYDSSSTRDGTVRSFEDMPIDLDDAVYDFYHHMSEVRIDRIVRIETVQRRLEPD
ncbi:hypothetical protein Tco_0670451 [Tanacetum coccineum]